MNERHIDQTSSDEDQRKNVFAWFGAAAYAAQLYEVELVTLIICIHRLSHPDTKIEYLNVLDNEFSKKPLEWLHKKIKEYTEIGSGFEDVMKIAKERRNYLMHRFFQANDERLGLKSGCEKMIDELQDIENLLRKANKTAELISKVVRRASGISEGELQNQVEESLGKSRWQ